VLEVVDTRLVDWTLIEPPVMVTLPLVMVAFANVKFPTFVVVLLEAMVVLPSVIGNPELPPPDEETVFNMITSHPQE
jgi:hypothetical protein